MTNVLTVDKVTKKFGKKEVFTDLSLTIPAGRVVGLLGENGIGKTTLLRMIADILKPTSGEIRIGEVPVSRATRTKVSFMLSPDNFYYFMSVGDALKYFRDFYDDFDYERAEKLCADFKLEAKDMINKLSKGNQERLCILLCLCRRVELYLLDEPIAGLDPKFKHESIKAMLTHAAEDATVLISSHLLRDLEAIFDEVIILKKDSVVQANCDEIRARGLSVETFYLENAGEEDEEGTQNGA